MGAEPFSQSQIQNQNHNHNSRHAPLVLGLQPFALVDNVATVDWSLLRQISGERGGSVPVCSLCNPTQLSPWTRLTKLFSHPCHCRLELKNWMAYWARLKPTPMTLILPWKLSLVAALPTQFAGSVAVLEFQAELLEPTGTMNKASFLLITWPPMASTCHDSVRSKGTRHRFPISSPHTYKLPLECLLLCRANYTNTSPISWKEKTYKKNWIFTSRGIR